MAERKNLEAGFVDVMTAGLGGRRTAQMLGELDASVPWEQLAAPIRRLPEYRRAGAGRPVWPAVVMLKCMMLAKWFNLSDPQLEECLQDRLSFRRFAGLSLHDATPDETTFVMFRKRLREAKIERTIFDAVVNHLDAHGLLVREGTLVDATILTAPRGRKREDDTSTRDPDASFTRKHGVTYHGYKGHIAMDGSKIVKDFRFTTAKAHDGASLDDMCAEESSAVVADAMYDSTARRDALRARGVFPAIAYQRRRGQQQLTALQTWLNEHIAKIRARVEHPFATLKHQMGHQRVRYRGLERNACDFCMALIALNLRRGAFLMRAT